MASTYDKEASKISFYELAPSLQDKFNKLANLEQFNNVKMLVDAIYSRVGSVVITAGLDEPVHGITHGADGLPLIIEDNKAIHLNTGAQVLEARVSDRWARHRLVYK